MAKFLAGFFFYFIPDFTNLVTKMLSIAISLEFILIFSCTVLFLAALKRLQNCSIY